MKDINDVIASSKEYLVKNREKLEKLKITIKEQDKALAGIKKDLQALGVSFGNKIEIPTQMQTLMFPKELSDSIKVMRDLIESLPKNDEVLPIKKASLHHSRKLQML